jgi:hypothetical protein
VRRENFAISLLISVAVVFAAATGCNGDKPAQAPAGQAPRPAAALTIDPRSDTVSGCVEGAPLVKVLVQLEPRDGRCVAEVTPASVCVAQGGVVRFKIRNDCGALPADPDRPAVEITPPRFKRGLDALRVKATEQPALFVNCSLRIPQLDAASSRVLWCDVAEDALDGFYKYGLQGQIEPLDPDVEVRPPRGGR